MALAVLNLTYARAMATVLMAWELGGGLGHVTVLAPLAERLLGAGHRVVLAVRDVSAAQLVFGDSNVQILQAPHHEGGVRHPIEPPSTLAHTIYNCAAGDPTLLRGLARAWGALFDLVAPDLVVFDHAPTALVAARERNFKKVTVGTGHCCPPPVEHFPDWRRLDVPGRAQQLADDEARTLGNINQLLEGQSKAPLERLSDLYTDVDDTLLTTLAELDHFSGRENADYFGTWVEPRGAPANWPSGVGPRVFAYLSVYDELHVTLNVLASSRLSTLVYISRCPEEFLQVTWPTLRIATAPLDLDEVAEHCDFAMTHAGHGTTLHFLLKGKPLCLLPLALEQRTTAEQVAEIGAGLCINPHEKATVQDGFDQMLNSASFTSAARAFAGKYADFDRHAQLERATARLRDLIG